MTERDFLVAAWRQRLLVLGIFLLIVGATAVLSKSLPKVYSSTSTLISLAGDEQTFDSVQAGQSLARSYADIMESPLIARLVAQRLGRPQDVEEIARSASFEPLTETQLLKVTAEDRDPETARRVADTYSTVFIDYSGRRLSPATGSRIALAVPAQRSDQAVRPRPTLNVLVAMMLGLPLALGLGFLRDRVDQRIRTTEDVEGRYHLPVLGEIPARGRSARSQAAFFEAVRTLRTSLRLSSLATGVPDTLAVVSSRRREGKTTLVVNLALAAAEVGSKVTIVDTDLREPAVQHQLLGPGPPLCPGLADYLSGRASVDEILHPTGHDDVSLVPAGSAPSDLSETLFAGPRARTLVDLVAEADLVLVDTPPLEAGGYGSLVSGWVDSVLAVVSLERSNGPRTDVALSQLERAGASVRGIVVTHAKGGADLRVSRRAADREPAAVER